MISDKEILKKIGCLRLEYILLMIFHVIVFGFVLYTSFRPEPLTEGTLISVRTVVILYTLAVIPVSLKYFAVLVKKIPASLPPGEKLKWYGRWMRLRLFAISTVLWINEGLYLFTRHESELLMTGIGAIALLFCVVNTKQLRQNLETLIQEDNEHTPTQPEDKAEGA